MFQFDKELFNAIVRSLWNTQQILNWMTLSHIVSFHDAIHHIPHVKTERKNKRFLKDFTKSKPDNKKKRFRQASELGLFM